MLEEYLSEFALGDFEATSQPLQSGLSKQKVADLQNILIKLGWKATTIPRPGAKDFGLFGSKTAGAWGQSAAGRKLNPTFQRASATEAYVDPNTLAALFTAAAGGAATTPARPQTVPAPAIQQTVAPAQPLTAMNTVTKGAREVSNLLYAVGWTTAKLPKTEVYTQKLANAWATSAKLRNMPVELKPTTSAGLVFVHKDTFDRIAADAVKGKVVKDAPVKDVVIAGTLVHPVLHLQELLYGVGWTKKKLAKDGKYGPQTKKAWGVSAKTRKLPELFERVDGNTARVAQATYDKIKADAQLAPVPTPYVPPKPEPVVPAGQEILIKPVADTQNVLIGLGWKSTTIPRPGVKDFGLFGPKTKAAWESSAKRRGLDTLFERVDGKTVKVSTKAYVAMLEEVKRSKSKGKDKPAPTPGPAPGPTPSPPPSPTPAPADVEVLAVRTVQQSLNVRAKAKLADDGTWGPKTEKALRSWLDKQPGGKRAKFVVKSKVKGASTVQLPKAFAAVLRDTRAPTPGPTPGPIPAPAPSPVPAPAPITPVEDQTVALLIKASTQAVPVIAVQHALAVMRKIDASIPSADFTGAWDKATSDAFFVAFRGSDKLDEAQQRVWRTVLSKVASPDARTVNLIPRDAAAVLKGEQLWQAEAQRGGTTNGGQQGGQTSQEPEPVGGDCNSLGPVFSEECKAAGGMTAYQNLRRQTPQQNGGVPADTHKGGYTSDGGSGGSSGGGVYDGGGGGPTTDGGGGIPGGGDVAPPPVVAANNPAVIWDQAVEALRAVGTDGPRIAKAIEDAKATGGTIRPEVLQAYTAWQASVERLKQRVAAVLEKSPQAQAAIDGASGGSQAQALSALEAYFGELAGPSADVLDLLKSPLFTAPLSGLGQVAQVAGWAARVGGPLWAKMIELLQLPVVKSAVVTGITVQGVGDALNAETVAFKDTNQQLNQLVAEGKLTTEQADVLRPEGPTSPWTAVALTVVALGGGYLYLRHRKRS